MSVSHPLLKQLKGHILDLHKGLDGSEIRDHHPHLLPLCETLETIFREGLRATTTTAFGLTKKDYWFWIHRVFEQKDKYRIPFSLADAVESTLQSRKVYTNTGRGRLFIRTTLCKKILQTLVACFFEDEVFVFSMYDPNSSILGNEILAEIFSSLLYEINKIDFKLELKNASFLDDTWNLGVYRKYEFVPCKEMGITFGYLKGRAIVVKVEEGSVAAEEDQVEPGDVLDELYGRILYRGKRGLISSLAHQFQGLPIYLTVVKGTCPDGSIYPPLKVLFEKLCIRKELERKLSSKHKNDGKELENCDRRESDSDSACTNLKFDLLLMAKFLMQKDGRASQIEKAINKAIDLNLDSKNIIIEIDETKLKISDKTNSKCVLYKHFTEISACGRKQSHPDIFALITGNTTCTIAEEFHCYVIKAPSDSVAKTILSCVAQGFGRTHWEV